VAIANKACQLNGGKNESYLDTLAAAYAEIGDFQQARQWQKKALAANTDEKRTRELRSRLDLYERNKPYREELKKR
jgi:serine/threonine-protein kinase